MRYLNYLWLFSLIISCKKVVDLSLPKSDSKLVIEAIISNEKTGAIVKISKSVSFNALNEYPAIHGAVVYILDSNRQRGDTLKEVKDLDGSYYYNSLKIKAISGHTYLLSVKTGDQLYQARSVMPDSVNFNGISILSDNQLIDSSTIFSLIPRYVDPSFIGNYYQFIQYIDRKKDKAITVFNDNVGNGLPNERPIFTKDIDIKLNDTVLVQMICIDQNVYKYFYQLSLNQDGSQNVPANPISNISSGALGYFSAQYVQSKTIIIDVNNN